MPKVLTLLRYRVSCSRALDPACSVAFFVCCYFLTCVVAVNHLILVHTHPQQMFVCYVALCVCVWECVCFVCPYIVMNFLNNLNDYI